MGENTSGDDRDGETYLFIVEYEEDAERKRIEYLFNNWDDGEIANPAGLVRVAEDVDHDDLFERVAGKVPAEQVQSYRLEPVEADVDEQRLTVEQTVNATQETVDAFIEYMFTKKKAVLQSATHNEYEVYTKKGRADVSYRLNETDGETTVTITVEGYPPAPEFLADFFETELTEYANSQR